MGDTITAWHDMQEENGKKDYSEYANQYIWLLDFNDGKVYRYDISGLCNYNNNWNPDSESCESFLYGAGHKVSDCEWMVTKTKTFENGN